MKQQQKQKHLKVEMKMGIVQLPHHYQPQERNSNEAQTPEKRKALLRQNLQFSRCRNPNNNMYGRNNHNLKHIICPNKKHMTKM